MCGTVDVDGLLAGMPRRLFDEWLAYYQVEPWGDEWDQAGTIAAAAHNAAFIAGGYPELPEGMRALRAPDHFIPGRKAKTPLRVISDEEDQALMAKLYGS